MATLTIQRDSDLITARNVLRKRLAGRRWTPSFRARAAATLTVLTELVLRSRKPGTLDMIALIHPHNQGLELRCEMLARDGAVEPLDELNRQLAEVVDELDLHHKHGSLHISARLWQIQEPMRP